MPDLMLFVAASSCVGVSVRSADRHRQPPSKGGATNFDPNAAVEFMQRARRSRGRFNEAKNKFEKVDSCCAAVPSLLHVNHLRTHHSVTTCCRLRSNTAGVLHPWTQRARSIISSF